MSLPLFRREYSVKPVRSSNRSHTENNNTQGNNELRDLMPCRWSCCSYGEDCGITLDDDGLTLYTSFSNQTNLSHNFILVIAEKPFPTQSALNIESYNTKTYAASASTSPDVPWEIEDPNVDTSLIRNLPGQIDKYFYFEITVVAGTACIGLQPSESIKPNPLADTNNNSDINRYPVVVGMIPGENPNSIGFSLDGNIYISGESKFKIIEEDQSSDNEVNMETIGCGLRIGGTNNVFFTKNGKIVQIDDSIDTCLSGNIMFPVVSLQTEGTTVIANFGEKPLSFVGTQNIQLITLQNSGTPIQSEASLADIEIKNKEVVCGSTSQNIDSHKYSRLHRNNALKSIEISREDHDLKTAITNSMHFNPSSPLEFVTKEEMEEWKDYARELRSLNSDHDPDVISSREEMVSAALQKVQYTVENCKTFESSIEIMELLHLNEFLIDALNISKKTRKLPLQNLESATSSVNDGVGDNEDLPTTESKRSKSEVRSLIHNKDIFSLICMLRSYTCDRLEAATALLGIAKDEGRAPDRGSKLRDQIRSSGGMHSLLTLFKSSKNNSEMKLATALAIAYLIPSFNDSSHCQGDLGLRVVECLQFLVNSPKIPAGSDVAPHEVREVAGLALTHLWINVLQPAWNERNPDDESIIEPSKSELSLLFTRNTTRKPSNTNSSRQLLGRRRRIKKRQDMSEMQELLETTVSLVVTVADSEIDDASKSDKKERHSEQRLRYNVAVTVESLCTVEFARPVAVREGLLKVLVRWLSSNNVDLVRPAANALRDLTSLHDEYMAGWIHSQIVNEGTLPAIVKLSVSNQRDIRLAVAQILSNLSIAPHTRAAIVDAKGLNYLVQLIVYSTHDLPEDKIDEPLALAAGSALLRIAAGAMSHSSGWISQNLGIKISLNSEKSNDIIYDILECGALDPFVAMAMSRNRGNLRLMSVEALRIISEDVRIGQWTRQKLCNAGAAYACGTVLKQDISVVYSMLQPPKLKISEQSKSVDGMSEGIQPERAPLLELYHALHALANMLEPSTQQEEEALSLVVKFGDQDFTPSPCQDTLVKACMQTAESGGVESLLWMASLPVATTHFPQSSYTSTVDPNELLIESYRSLASLCPLLLSATSASKGFAKWAGHVLLALTGVLKREVMIDQGERVEMVRELQVDALQGLCSLAEYEPLKVMIIDECLPQLLQFKNDRDDISELSYLANQVCLALGFNEEEMDVQLVGNDPKLLAHWFCLERSLVLQAMARDEIRLALFKAWGEPLQQVLKSFHSSQVLLDDASDQNFIPIVSSNDDSVSLPAFKSKDLLPPSFLEAHISSSTLSQFSHDDACSFMRAIFENLADDDDSASLRNVILQQYTNIYGMNETELDGEDDSLYDQLPFNDSFFPLPFRGTGFDSSATGASPLCPEMGDDGDTVITAGSGTTNRHRSIYSRSPTVRVYENPRRECTGRFGANPFSIQCISSEREWILAHQKALAEFGKSPDNIWSEPYSNSSVPLPLRVQNLLDHYFPSSLIQDEILPFGDIQPDSSFNFRALAMPERRYFSFRREGQILSRIYEKHASSIDLDDVIWTLGFSNSTFGGEFAETLVQALYRCPVIQSVSFSRNRAFSTSFKRSISTSSTHHHADEEEDDGSTLLAYLAGSLPPWVTFLTFDNVLRKNAILALVNILETMGQRSAGIYGSNVNSRESEIPEAQSSHSSQGYGIFHGLAIRNSPQLAGDALTPIFRLLGHRNNPSRSPLNRPPLISLKVLDLSGNNLGDLCCATVLKIAHSDTSQSILERLDLSNNNIREGTAVVKVLEDYVNKYRLPQSVGAAGYNTWCSTLSSLNLADNKLHCGNAAIEIISMLKNNVLSIQSISLANNGLTGQDNNFLDTLTTSILSNTKLLNLNLSENIFNSLFLDTLLKRLLRTEETRMTAYIHFNGNVPQLTEYQDTALKTLTFNIRKSRILSHFAKKQKIINQLAGANDQSQNHLENGNLHTDTFHNSMNSSKIGNSSTSSLEVRNDLLFSDSFSASAFGEISSNLNSNPSLKLPYREQLDYKSDTFVKPRPTDLDNLSLYQREKKSRRNGSTSTGNKITVLFSAPLVWKDTQNMLRPIEMLDFELERELLWQCFKEASMDIELSFDNATADRLQATMTKCCGCLHYSGHGNPNFLTFEDGKGGLHWLEVNQLKDLISNGVKGGGAPFTFVFVSACHSGLAGETFVNAGVPHVVCCKQESQLMDSAALAFTRAFYLALAIGRTVKDSFEIGRQAVAVAPSVPDSDQEMKKFVLLPKNGKHDVPVFDAEGVPEWPPPSMSAGSSRRFIHHRKNHENDVIEQSLPTPPQGFLGREVDMYVLMNKVLTKRFVSLVGITGIGRSSLASAVCHYINDRKSTMIAIETIICIRARKSRGGDRYGSFITPLHKRLVSAGKALPLDRVADLDDIFHSIFSALSKTKALIVFDRAEVLEGTIEAQEFPLFLSSLFRETRNVRVLITARKPLGLSSLRGVGEHVVKLGPLNFKSTVRLFAILCPHVHTGDERRRLLELLVPDEEAHICVTDHAISERCKTIFGMLGNGIPARTFDVAYQMTKEQYKGLLQVGQNNEEKIA